ncbi:hypothetical protein AgCh_020294 [Apium graveolens]
MSLDSEEDMQLVNYISRYGIWNWTQMPKHAGLSRTGKSCRLRWMNYLDPQVKRGNYTQEEDEIIIKMRQTGSGWSAIAASLPGRTDNEIKNRWHTRLIKKSANNMEQIVSEIDTLTMYCDYQNNFDFPEASMLEAANEDYSLSSHMLNTGTSSNDVIPPTFGTSADPHVSFWREPFVLENVYDDIDEYATYVDPQFGMPNPEEWFGEPFNPYFDML